MEVPKEIIRPGVHTYMNQVGLPERLTVTNEKIKYYHDQGNLMLAANLSIPVPLEHQTEATPQTPSQKAATQLLNNAGFVKRYEIRKVGDQDRLFGILDIPDKDILKKLPTTIRSVSPWINSFTDGNGKRWDGVISHVALTTRPRIASQEPFGSATAMLSMISQLQDQPIKEEGVNLSSAGLLKKSKSGAFKPEFPIAFSLMTGVKLSKEEFEEIDDDDDEENDADKGDGGKKEEKTEGEPTDQFAKKDGEMEGMEESAGDVSFEELIPHLLEMHGIHVPAGGKGKEFLQALVRGLLASAKEMASEPEGGVLGDPAQQQPVKQPGPVKQESPPMYMSLTAADVAKITDPKERQTAEAFLSLRDENLRNKAIADSATKHILADAAGARQRRVERLCQKLPPAARDKLLQRASGAVLSLQDGVVIDPLADVFDLLESGIPDLPAMLKADAKFSVQDHPSDGTMTDKRAEELANHMTRNLRTPQPAA